MAIQEIYKDVKDCMTMEELVRMRESEKAAAEKEGLAWNPDCHGTMWSEVCEKCQASISCLW